MSQGTVAITEGNCFVVSDSLGDIEPDSAHGMFSADTRFLSAYSLRLNGQTPLLLSSGNTDHNAATFYAVNRSLDGIAHGWLSVVRTRRVGSGFDERVEITNNGPHAVEVVVELTLAADFADIFEVRGAEDVCRRDVRMDYSASSALFTYDRPGFQRQTRVSFSQPAVIENGTASFAVLLAPKESWQVDVAVTAIFSGQPLSKACESMHVSSTSPVGFDLPAFGAPADERWVATTPTIECAEPELKRAYRRAIADLNALRLRTPTGDYVPAAGLPWYLALFGRDSIITALQTLPLGPQLALGTLRTLAYYQARELDDFRDQQPGKMPHEIRFGELACLDIVPHSRYYGTIDATPLYLVLLSETYRWTGDTRLLEAYWPVIERALEWIDRHGDMDGDGYVEYIQRSPRGLINQGWKDSTDCLAFADGRLAHGPIALAEVQGYVYDAKLRMADVYDLLGHSEAASRLRSQAATLKSRFNRDFWLPGERFFALALDGQKRPVDSITSNPGHCLWSGIVDDDKIEAVVSRLMAPDMFSGWGVRTMSTLMASYNPISYHNGSVWPHDNSLIAAGLRRYGYDSAAERIVRGLFGAACRFPHSRLPELFAGYDRRPEGFPVEYPSANAPQAWAAGAVVSLLQTALGLCPQDNGITAAAFPSAEEVRWIGVPYRDTRWDIVGGAVREHALAPAS